MAFLPYQSPDSFMLRCLSPAQMVIKMSQWHPRLIQNQIKAQAGDRRLTPSPDIDRSVAAWIRLVHMAGGAGTDG